LQNNDLFLGTIHFFAQDVSWKFSSSKHSNWC